MISDSIIIAAQWVAGASGVWLIGLGVWMILRPKQALRALAAKGGTAAIHFGEMIIRMLAGGALIVAGPASRFPLIIIGFGGFLIVSALILMMLPRRWHAAYSTWWAERIPAQVVRLLAPLSILAGAAPLMQREPGGQ